MPRKKKPDTPPASPALSVVPRSITDEMREAYLDYAMSVITSRALPDVRDGLKPVHRRILYTMHQMGLTAGAKFRKSAAIVGDVMGKYHPHGDAAIYDALAKLAQDFATRYPLVWGQGNFGSIDGDPPAAMRYTEAKMTRIAGELLRDIEKDTVPWRPNYDGTRNEPEVLPANVPNLLLNGTLGIAVGMATNIPPHNVREVLEATIHLIDHKKATTEDLLEFIKGPDFPTGAIAFNRKDIHHAYATGKGGIVVRGEAEIMEDKKGQASIIITSIPYRVNKAELITKIADLVRDKKIEGVRDLRDESTKDVRIVIELRASAHPQTILNKLYKHTPLEDTFHVNMVALVDGVPQTLSLKGILEAFIGHRKEVVRRRCLYDLAKAEARAHILEGLSKALDHIDAIIKLIRASKDVPSAHAALMRRFKFSDRQATAILEMRLQKLSGLERKKIEEELKEVRALIVWLKEILGSERKMETLIKKELKEVAEKFGDARRTKIVAGGVKHMTMEDLVPDEETVLVLTEGGYLKRTNPAEYRKQKRGGVGVVDLNTKEEDFVTHFVTASTHDEVLFFSNRGKVYKIKMYEVPEGKRATRGKSVMNFLSLAADERITSVIPMGRSVKETGGYLAMVTRAGAVKKVKAEDFYDVRKSGLIALKLAEGDELVDARFIEDGGSLIVVSAKGQAIRFKESDVRVMGRAAGGVRGIKLGRGDAVVGMGAVRKGESAKDLALLVLTGAGYGKRTKVSEFKLQKRGGSGVKAAAVKPKTGEIMAARIVRPEDAELIVMSKKGQVIRCGVNEIPVLGRLTQGVRIMKLRAGDGIAATICI